MNFTLYSKLNCNACDVAKDLLKKSNIEFTEYVVGKDISKEELLWVIPGSKVLPQAICDGKIIGNWLGIEQFIKDYNANREK